MADDSTTAGLPARPFDSGSQRLEFFSDAILAIAITLLAFNIHVHPAKASQLAGALWAQWPSYLAYALSFCTIGLVWVAHHAMFRRVGGVDRPLLLINLGLMMFVAILPFSTGVLAHYARLGVEPAEYSTVLYALNMAAIGIAFLGLWVYLRFHLHLFIGSVDAASVNRSIRISSIIPVAWMITAGLAFVSRPLSYSLWMLITVYIALGPATRRIPIWFVPARQSAGSED